MSSFLSSFLHKLKEIIIIQQKVSYIIWLGILHVRTCFNFFRGHYLGNVKAEIIVLYSSMGRHAALVMSHMSG